MAIGSSPMRPDGGPRPPLQNRETTTESASQPNDRPDPGATDGADQPAAQGTSQSSPDGYQYTPSQQTLQQRTDQAYQKYQDVQAEANYAESGEKRDANQTVADAKAEFQLAVSAEIYGKIQDARGYGTTYSTNELITSYGNNILDRYSDDAQAQRIIKRVVARELSGTSESKTAEILSEIERIDADPETNSQQKLKALSNALTGYPPEVISETLENDSVQKWADDAAAPAIERYADIEAGNLNTGQYPEDIAEDSAEIFRDAIDGLSPEVASVVVEKSLPTIYGIATQLSIRRNNGVEMSNVLNAFATATSKLGDSPTANAIRTQIADRFIEGYLESNGDDLIAVGEVENANVLATDLTFTQELAAAASRAGKTELGDNILEQSAIDEREAYEQAPYEFIDQIMQLPADEIPAFINDPKNAELWQRTKLEIQNKQDYYEERLIDRYNFSQEQLDAMRVAFEQDDGFLTNGELLLAYPSREERNERVTQQYYNLSSSMSSIVGDDNANWASFAVWASSEIGRNLAGSDGIDLAELAGGDPRFWLSKGNSMLISDIGPGFQYFTQTFADGQNRDMPFEQFWSNFEQEFSGRNISYLPGGSGDPENDMKNAFKAYYEAMQLRDKEQAATDPTQKTELANRRSQLMLYANTLVGLQEQKIIQPDIENGMKALGIVNLWGSSAGWLNFHLPDANGPGDIRIDTNRQIAQQDNRVDLADTSFTTVDGQTIQLDETLRNRLNSLPGNVDEDGDEFDIANAPTSHWEGYQERMGFIYHLFANYQRYPSIFAAPP